MPPIPLGFKKLMSPEPAVEDAKHIDNQRMMEDLNNMPIEQMSDMPQVPSFRQSPTNPFMADSYRNVNLPDIPVGGGGSMADTLLNNEEVPEEIRAKYWNIFHKDNVLTFLDEDRKLSKLLNFDIQKIDVLNTLPYYDYTFERELEFGVLRNVYETKLDRALGFKGSNTKNERIVLQSQFTEQRQISEDGTSSDSIRQGFFKRLLRRK